MQDDRYGRRDGGHLGSDERDSQTQQRLQSLLSDPVGGNLQTLVDTIQKVGVRTMSDREITRWQHNRIYPRPAPHP